MCYNMYFEIMFNCGYKKIRIKERKTLIRIKIGKKFVYSLIDFQSAMAAS